MNILIAVPTFENINPETFKSIYDLEKIPGVKFDFEFVKGYDCAVARNMIIKKALDGKYNYILMVDSDIILPKDALVNLIDDDQYVVLGYYPRKNEPEISEIFKIGFGYPNENKLLIDEIVHSQEDLVKINGGGFGCALINMDIVDKLNNPIVYFNYLTYPDGDHLSEDLYFCSLVRNCGINIYVDTRVRCKHIGKKIVL